MLQKQDFNRHEYNQSKDFLLKVPKKSRDWVINPYNKINPSVNSAPITIYFQPHKTTPQNVLFKCYSALILLTEKFPYFSGSITERTTKITGVGVKLRKTDKRLFCYRLKLEILPLLKQENNRQSWPFLKETSVRTSPLFYEEINDYYDHYNNLPDLKVNQLHLI
jgi:hypothetical protein